MNKILIITLSIIILNCDTKKLNIYDSQDYIKISKETLLLGEKIYSKSCSHCHTAGVAGAKKIDNYSYWNGIASKGMKKVFDNASRGYNGTYGMMPPKGNCLNCSDKELKASIYFMLYKAENNRTIK